MRTPQLIAALTLAAGMIGPAVAAAPAHAMASSCVVTLYDIDVSNVREKDGVDELRFKVDGNWFPQNGHFEMSTSRPDGDPADFGYPSTIVQRHENKYFELREVDPPIITGGQNLGEAWAFGYDCDDLGVGDIHIEDTVLSSSKYAYTVRLKLTGQ
ncbi:hypothetical protein GCM10009733_042470 [Nonomuraea maheshkhaliensis]|uniref:PLAT domain-containing protein n=1 Tax=Nonomuraea maheshkhaliensis TaxID=419590 RepID=A0ABN2FCQ0_9ACTN